MKSGRGFTKTQCRRTGGQCYWLWVQLPAGILSPILPLMNDSQFVCYILTLLDDEILCGQIANGTSFCNNESVYGSKVFFVQLIKFLWNVQQNLCFVNPLRNKVIVIANRSHRHAFSFYCSTMCYYYITIVYSQEQLL